MIESPVAHVIAGPNGSGKTTFATEFLPKSEHAPRLIATGNALHLDVVASDMMLEIESASGIKIMGVQ